ncbi:ankyrin repeat domain-containing protein SOWAHB isoform X2 [Planococcus citri]|uniref:ankyrin repeat domain-containing protein SOWAHB isoform X2 n=1 Tax=Planococcus citri TaxID=170843 RepID=UPI0031F722D0
MSKEYSTTLRLTADSVRDYIVNRGGKVYNTELVKYFRPLLTDPETKELAREQFKRIVNQIAIVTRDERGEKFLVLKKPSKYGADYENSPIGTPEPGLSSATSFSSLATGIPHASSIDSLHSISSLSKQPPPYRSPPPVLSPKSVHGSNFGYPTSPSESSHEKTPPPVPPRRKSSDKIKFNNKENEPDENSKPSALSSEESENKVAENEQKISVKERTQRFNRLASTEGPIPKIQQPVGTSAAYKKRFDKGTLSDREDEDSASVASFDPRSREWLVRAAQGNYQALAKMVSENPKLAKFKVSTEFSSSG